MTTFRPAAAADVPALHALIEGAYRGEGAKAGWTHEADLLGGQRTDAAALLEIIADPAQTLVLAEADGALVGCVCVARKPGGLGYLGMLTVRPTMQGAGLGRALVAEAERVARGFAARAMEMTVIVQRGELIAWYERLGYAATGERRAFPLDDQRFGLPKRRDLEFAVLAKAL
ncbi:MAG: GNAT family N-acetyltransferase [Hyphomonadaceae bacterium]|nr:GNAT family N-acetyltransferase [Hyphomonadaceae bacterium]